jgi:hypothetical protein
LIETNRFIREKKMKEKLIWALVLGEFISGPAEWAQASPINTIQFYDGNVLNVQGAYGSGTDTAYLAIDFNAAGVTYAWQFNWTAGTTVNGWQMMEAIAGQSVLTTSPPSGTTDVTNPSGDPNLTVTAEYYNSLSEHLVNNMQYGTILGASGAWELYSGSYNLANVSAGDPQGMTWAKSGVGVDELTLSNGEFIGWVDVLHQPPAPTLAETPEPQTAIALVIMGAWMLSKRVRRAARVA